ncbi:MAG: hypothetical protein ACJ73W_05345 [Rubrobacteraceae bacterium]
MSTRTATWLAWALAGLALTMFGASVALFVLARSAHVPGSWSSSTVGDVALIITYTVFPVVGALIASRRHRNPIGWICLADGLLWALIVVGEEYSTYGVAIPGSVPFPVTINALLYAWLWVPAVGLLGVYLLLLFPDGRLPSRRWRPLAWIAGAVIVVLSLVTLLTPGPLEGLGGARNPFGLEGHPWVVAAGWVFLPLLPLCMLASALSLVLRYRRSRGEVRQQIKWIVFAASLMGLLYLAVMGAGTLSWIISPEAPGDLGTQTLWGAILENVMLLSFAGVPVALGFAVLKYRLYDIDIFINRALVYGLLTATLAGVYLGGVILLQYLFRALTGQESQLAIVASTLAIAALFIPLRRRVQRFVDRRFYRRKYDAAKTLASFNARLRDETDLDTLVDDVVGVVSQAMQPEHASLWLRPDTMASKVQRSE